MLMGRLAHHVNNAAHAVALPIGEMRVHAAAVLVDTDSTEALAGPLAWLKNDTLAPVAAVRGHVMGAIVSLGIDPNHAAPRRDVSEIRVPGVVGRRLDAGRRADRHAGNSDESEGDESS